MSLPASIEINNHSEQSSLDTKFKQAVSSSFFKRYAISWLIWNYKIVLILFFVKNSLVTSIKDPKVQINRITWIEENYNSWDYNLLHILIWPALTALIAFFILELFNVLSFWITKKSWKCRVKIENRLEETLEATNGMVSDYRKITGIAELEMNRLKTEKDEIDRKYYALLSEKDALNQDKYVIDKKYNDLLSEKDVLNKEKEELENKYNFFIKKGELKKDDLSKAEEVIKTLNEASSGQEMIKEFNSIFSSITSKKGEYKNPYPSNEFLGLVKMGIFSHDITTQLCKVTNIGEFVNLHFVLNPYKKTNK